MRTTRTSSATSRSQRGVRFAAPIAVLALMTPLLSVFGGSAFAAAPGDDLAAPAPAQVAAKANEAATTAQAPGDNSQNPNEPDANANGAATTAQEPGDNRDNPNRDGDKAAPDGPAGKVTVCRPTGSSSNPFNLITIGAPAEQARDVIPDAAGNCPEAETAASNNENADHNKITVCRPTGSATNPYSLITIGAPAQQPGDLLPNGGQCPIPSAPAPATDLCANLPGSQLAAPEGRVAIDGDCVQTPTSVAGGPSREEGVGPIVSIPTETFGGGAQEAFGTPLVTVAAPARPVSGQSFGAAALVAGPVARSAAGQLPRTGADPVTMLALAMLLLGSGMGLVVLGGTTAPRRA